MRRLFYILVAAVVLSMGLCACDGEQKRKSILKVYNWADYIDEELLSGKKSFFFML